MAWVAPGDTWAKESLGGWQPGPEAYHPTRLLVRFADNIVHMEAATNAIERMGCSVRSVAAFGESARFPNGVRIGIIDVLDEMSVDDAMNQLAAVPGIMYVERDPVQYPDQAPVIPDDTFFERMWALHNENLPQEYIDPRMESTPIDDADIDMPEAWEIFKGSRSVIVAVIDTGCYIDHPDLAANIWTNPGEIAGNGIDDDGNGHVDDIHGWDFYNNDNTVWDPDQRNAYGELNDNHGTHCAGTIGAVSNNGMGVTGINWDIQIMPLKFLGPNGGFTSDAILALEYAAANGAMITSNSWGGGPYNQILKDAIEASNMLFIAAAGNSPNDNDVNPHYPSSYDSPNIIAVAASMQNDRPCEYPGWWGTSYGATTVDLFAPGGYILSTLPPDPPPALGEPGQEAYGFMYGTSMATPHVTGVAALLAGAYPDLPQYPGAPGWAEGSMTVKDAILGTVDKNYWLRDKCVTGGRLNARNALALSLPPVITSCSADPTAGRPPLSVSFTASAVDPDGDVVDFWWDFGDGSPAVHQFAAEHVYEESGIYLAKFHAVDNAGLESVASIEIRVFIPPHIGVAPSSVDATLKWGEKQTHTVTISNTGEGPLEYSIDIELEGLNGKLIFPGDKGGPDGFGYVWLDNAESGLPVSEWEDIADVGVDLKLRENENRRVPLPFEFPFYGELKNEVCITSHGYLTFGTPTTYGLNAPIPSSAQPNDVIAPFWDSLTFYNIPTGTVHYYYNDREFIVQWTNVRRNGDYDGKYTFQVALTPEGTIRFRYLTMIGEVLDMASIGIENSDGTDGLQVAYNERYAREGLEVLFVPVWISAGPEDKLEGLVAPGASQDIDVIFETDMLPGGDWKADLIVHSNDTEKPSIEVDTTLHVRSQIPPVIKLAEARPWAGPAPLVVDFSAVVVDYDGEIVETTWDFGDGSAPVSGSLEASHTYNTAGEYDAVLTVVDDDGLIEHSVIHIVVGPKPVIGVAPASFTEVMRAHRRLSETLVITNSGDAPLAFKIGGMTAIAEDTATLSGSTNGDVLPEGKGGPDSFGYIWRDSDDPEGPTFDWMEISGVGTFLPTLKNNEYIEVDLPWEFPFYGIPRSKITISSNGYLTFGTKGGESTNRPIPYALEPNDLMAVWWTTLRPENGEGVFYYYDEPNDRFIVEWSKVPRLIRSGSLTFQAILYPDGKIVYQYLKMTFGSQYDAGKATIGIENGDGTDGCQVVYNKAGYIHDELAVQLEPFDWIKVNPTKGIVEPGESAEITVVFDTQVTPSGVLDGWIVVDNNDLLNPAFKIPVHIDVLPNQPPAITGCTVNPQRGPATTEFTFVAGAHDPDGELADYWWSFGDNSGQAHEFIAKHTYAKDGVYTATFCAVDNDGYESSATVEVVVQDPPSASWSPKQIVLNVAQGQTSSATITMSNGGPGRLSFGGNGIGEQISSIERPEDADQLLELGAFSTDGAYGSADSTVRTSWLPEEVGRVIKTWEAPWPITHTWGVGVNHETGEVIIGDPQHMKDFVVTPDGELTGTEWSVRDWAGAWMADMAWDGEYIWQVNVLGDNGIYQMDPQTGRVVNSITEGPWTEYPQNGLAYNPNDDTFFIAGFWDNIIYHIKGLSWDNPGEVLDQWMMWIMPCGLAYHPVADVLIIETNSWPDEILYVDPASHEVICKFNHPANWESNGAGIELDADGNLWVASQHENRMYLVETGLGPIYGVKWTPKEGIVEPGASAAITVTVDAGHATPGQHRRDVVLFTNDIDNPMIRVPVTMNVKAKPIIVQAAATPAVGEPPLEVNFHGEVISPDTPIASCRWDFGDGESVEGIDVVHTYVAPGLYMARLTVEDELGGAATRRVYVDVRPLPSASIDTDKLHLTVLPGGSGTVKFTLSNSNGNADLTFAVNAKNGPVPNRVPTIAPLKLTGASIDVDAPTSAGLYEYIDPVEIESALAASEAEGIGDIITSWLVPAPIEKPWGMGFDGTNVWISDINTRVNHIVTPEGIHTGRMFKAVWAASWPGDMAFDSRHNLMWQVNVGGDNGVYGMDPETGATVCCIDTGAWTDISQRGLAYCSDDDTFYIGGWNENIIYHFKGIDWDNPGEIIDQWAFPHSIAGLEWHPSGLLWVTSNAQWDMIYAVDPVTHAVIESIVNPGTKEYTGAGLAIDSEGNLWVMSQKENKVFQIDSGMHAIPGFEPHPVRGTVPAGDSMDIQLLVVADLIGCSGEDISKHLQVVTDDPSHPVLYVDVNVHIQSSPSVKSVSAAPSVGEPPLKVHFEAEAVPGEAAIADMWWDFGDGSEQVHAAIADHVYAELGVYEASFHVVDEDGVEAAETIEIEVRWLPVLEVKQSGFDIVMPPKTAEQDVLTIANLGNADMNFWVSVAPSFAESAEWKRYITQRHEKGDYANEPVGFAGAGAGGPDAFGYIWMDSQQPNGPSFDWLEISEIGTQIWMDDESGRVISLPFAFPFYGKLNTQVGVSSNGYLSFDITVLKGYFENTPIPDAASPNNLLAAFWDDLNPAEAGGVYTYYDEANERFIVEFKDVPRWGDNEQVASGGFTFQIVLKPDGTIIYQYLKMDGDVTSATVGIENDSGNDGLQVVYNAPYITDGLAVAFAPVGALLDVNPTHGFLVPGGSQDVVVTFGSTKATPGTYSLYIYVGADDPYRPTVAVPVSLKFNLPPAVKLTTPAGGEEWSGNQEITWTASDPDDSVDVLSIDLYWSQDGGSWNEIAKGLANTGHHTWNTAEVGSGGDGFRVRVVVTDPAGETAEAISEPFAIVNSSPVAAFRFSPLKPTLSDVVEFVDESTDDGEIVAWCWEFGDGAESSEPNPKHQYNAKGKFTVKLTVTDDGGLASTCEKQIQVVNVAPEVTILKPEAGAVWTGTRAIEYEAVDVDEDTLSILLEYDYLGDEAGWKLIADDEENTGKYLWDTSKLSKGGFYKVRVTAIDPDGGIGQGVSEEFTIIVISRAVVAAPNPARSLVTFYYDIEADGKLHVYDVAGRLVYSAELSAASNVHEWNVMASDRPVASGLYLYVVVTDGGETSEVGRLVIQR